MTTEQLLQRILDKSAGYAKLAEDCVYTNIKAIYQERAASFIMLHKELQAEHLATEAAKDEQLMNGIKPINHA